MEKAKFEDVAPYFTRDRLSHQDGEIRANLIAEFLRVKKRCEHVEVQLRGTKAPGWDVGSATRFNLFFDKNWLPIHITSPSQEFRFMLSLLVSERGPFVTSSGGEWIVSPDDLKPHPQISLLAEKKSKRLALSVATRFGFRYLDATWLRQFRLNVEGLTSDVSLSLDFSEPDALNVLFDEFS
jgi:hypothetical protein